RVINHWTNMADEEPKPLNYIPEVILKKRKQHEEHAINRRKQLEERISRNKENRETIFKRPEQYVEEYRNKELDLIQMKHRAKRQKITPGEVESNLLFVIRIKGKNDIHPKTKKILLMLGLGRIFSGVFVKASEGIIDMLKKVEPYITYGYPNLKSIKELIYKKGHMKLEKQKIPLTDNNTVEQVLGKHGIICIEDIVHEIANVGPHFKEVTSILWPFRLSKPELGLSGKKKPYKEGGDAGNREQHINELISKMN
ncbi:Ribosomal protein L30, ferredoxin-like fold domain, partial [Dillenia turbinata]